MSLCIDRFFYLPLRRKQIISFFRWDLKMGQRGLLDRLPVAHTAPITTLDWYSGGDQAPHAISFPSHQGTDDCTGNTLGWVASSGLDRCVKVRLGH